jgi:hypothetical protein
VHLYNGIHPDVVAAEVVAGQLVAVFVVAVDVDVDVS